MKRYRTYGIAVGAVIVVALSVAALALVIRQPWQQKWRVVSASIPQSGHVLELWEKPYWCFGFGHEYETWLVVQFPSGERRWNLIDTKYVTLREVLVLISSDRQRIRVETTGRGTDFHMIAEYDLKRRRFRAASQQTVRNTEGWAVLATARVR
jgi:hypothetical protein